MYRYYKNPFDIEDRLEALRADYQFAAAEGADEDVLIELSISIHELEDELRFAWDDDEFYCDGEPY